MIGLERSTASREKVRLALACFGVAILTGMIIGAVSSPQPSSGSGQTLQPHVGSSRSGPRPPQASAPVGDAAGATDVEAAVHSQPDQEEGLAEPSETDVAEAHQAAADFAAAYASYSHDDRAAATVERVRPFTTTELAAQLARDSGAIAGRAELAERRQRATASAFTVHTNRVGDGYVDVLVVVRQEVSWRDGTETRWPSYLLRVVPSDAGWRVSGLLR